MKFLKKNWKKIVFAIVGVVVVLVVGVFLWMKSWKTYSFPNSNVTFEFPSGSIITKNENGYSLIYKNLLSLHVDDFNCLRDPSYKNLDKETCGEKAVIGATIMNAVDGHPFYNNVEKDIIKTKVDGHFAALLTLHTNTAFGSK